MFNEVECIKAIGSNLIFFVRVAMKSPGVMKMLGIDSLFMAIRQPAEHLRKRAFFFGSFSLGKQRK